MKRWLFNLATVISLLLGLALCCIWIRTRVPLYTGIGWPTYIEESVGHASWDPVRWEHHIWFVHWDNGHIELRGWTYQTAPNVPDSAGGPVAHAEWNHSAMDHARGANTLEFRFFEFQWTSTAWRIGAEIWLLALMTVALPFAWLVQRLRRRRRHAAGTCPACGYDLRATPERCPECGTIP